MKNFNTIIQNLKEKKNFSLVRFNDGEMKAIQEIGSIVARNCQIVDRTLHDKLLEALNHKQENYWIGKPCETCFPKYRKSFDEIVNSTYPFLTYAVILCNNGNWKKFINVFNDCCINKNCIWISGHDQDLNKLKIKFANLNITNNIELPIKNCWSEYNNIKEEYKNFKKDDLIFLSCGPLSRVLCYEWFNKRPDCTFLDIGSTFDPFTRNIWHRCHIGKLPFCKECNYECI